MRFTCHGSALHRTDAVPVLIPFLVYHALGSAVRFGRFMVYAFTLRVGVGLVHGLVHTCYSLLLFSLPVHHTRRLRLLRAVFWLVYAAPILPRHRAFWIAAACACRTASLGLPAFAAVSGLPHRTALLLRCALHTCACAWTLRAISNIWIGFLAYALAPAIAYCVCSFQKVLRFTRLWFTCAWRGFFYGLLLSRSLSFPRWLLRTSLRFYCVLRSWFHVSYLVTNAGSLLCGCVFVDLRTLCLPSLTALYLFTRLYNVYIWFLPATSCWFLSYPHRTLPVTHLWFCCSWIFTDVCASPADTRRALCCTAPPTLLPRGHFCTIVTGWFAVTFRSVVLGLVWIVRFSFIFADAVGHCLFSFTGVPVHGFLPTFAYRFTAIAPFYLRCRNIKVSFVFFFCVASSRRRTRSAFSLVCGFLHCAHLRMDFLCAPTRGLVGMLRVGLRDLVRIIAHVAHGSSVLSHAGSFGHILSNMVSRVVAFGSLVHLRIAACTA